VVDNSRGVTAAEECIMDLLDESKIPYVVFANKQDLDDSTLEIGREVDVIPTIATEDVGLLKGLKSLLGKIS